MIKPWSMNKNSITTWTEAIVMVFLLIVTSVGNKVIAVMTSVRKLPQK